MDQQFILKKFSHFHYSIIVFPGCFPELSRVNGNARVYVIMQRQNVVPEHEIPGEGVEVVFLVSEFYFEIIGENIGHFVESFEAAIVVYDSFGASEVGA
jgi:hypothetical protein